MNNAWICKIKNKFDSQIVSRATGLSRTTVTQGLRDLEEDGSLSLDSDRLRREGGGRKYSRHKSPELLKAIEGILEESSAGEPNGAYDINRNEGFVNVGMSSDTSEFAVNSLWQWWRDFGKKRYPNATEILVCADGGGSNGSRARAWKFYLQELANKLGIPITVAHYPPGTSKWNKMEHRMFSFISMNWKGRPLENYESVVRLIASTTTKNGLNIKARLDRKQYKTGMKVSDEEFDNINLKFAKKFPQWNYTIHPI